MTPLSYVTPEAFGAVGDGVADDSNAIEKAFVVTGRHPDQATIFLDPAKTYRTTRVMRLEDDANGITVTGGGTWLVDHAGTGVNFATQLNLHPIHAFTAADKGDTSITITSGASLGVGDYVIIYTGQVQTHSAAGYALGFPDSELNQVAAVNGNDITFLWPLAKDYRQEYWADGAGTLGVATSPTPTAFPAPIGIRKINPMVGLHFDGITIRKAGSGPFLRENPFIDLQFTDVIADCDGSLMSVDGWTGSMTGCQIHCRNSDSWWFTTAYSSRSVVVSDCEFTSDTTGYVHIHEGSADIAFTDVSITNAAGQAFDANYPFIVGIRARGYDIEFTRLTITNASTSGSGIRADGSYGPAFAGTTGFATDYVFSGTGSPSDNDSTLFTINGVPGAP